ncbi:MAG: hypothetical protein H7641_08410, partial [Candidatus Heimdallarchaeota archaeon]|nr:hypothetical protein [Candidatus Heimdallarchaeota archaeon]MCK4877589.1 hypothetical protein [Candidatus Heimdallarchaeota archaeon]
LLSVVVSSYIILYIYEWSPPQWIAPLVLSIGLLLNLSLIYPFRKWSNCYKLSVYSDFLTELKKDQYSVKSFSDYDQTTQLDKEKIHVFLRHDVDLSLNRLLNIIKLEIERGISSTSFFRLHSEKYVFEKAIPIIHHLDSEGFEIGFHYEVLSRTKGNIEEALSLFTKELNELREIVPIKVVSHHGDKYSNQRIWPLVDKTKLDVWSAYDMKRDIYITDTGGKNMFKQRRTHIFDKLKKAKPGDVVQILIHADWWY